MQLTRATIEQEEESGAVHRQSTWIVQGSKVLLIQENIYIFSLCNAVNGGALALLVAGIANKDGPALRSSLRVHGQGAKRLWLGRKRLCIHKNLGLSGLVNSQDVRPLGRKQPWPVSD